MFKRLMLIGLLAISGSAMLGTEAIAKTCTLRSSSGTCLIWSGSVEGDIVTDSQGSVQQHPMIDFEIHPTGNGVIICANSGAKKKPAPGIQVVIVNLNTDNFNFADTKPILKSNVKNGVAAVTALAFLSADQLDVLSANCPNTGWTVEDGVPCDADIHIKLRNDVSTIINEVRYHCSLNTVNFSCENLQWIEDKHRFERRQYECTLQP